ncbi:unnamed protein product [Ectocarpus sp. 4 AP-2014]
MNDDEQQRNKGTKRPWAERGDMAAAARTSNGAGRVGDQEQPRQEQLQGEAGGGRGKAGSRGSADNLPRAYSRISPLPQQHPRLANTDLPGCIVRQDFHCAVLSDAFGQEGVEQCLSFHPNGLAVVQLAPTHPAVGNGDRQERRAYCSTAIVALDFDAGGCNVLESATVKGKKKKGALQLRPTTILCNAKTRGGKEYKVCTGTSGELIQANKALAENPGLMSEDPLGRGWLAIVRLKPRDLRRLQEALGVTEER